MALPFSKRTASAVAVFDCLQVAAPAGIQQLALGPAIASLALCYAQLATSYASLIRQDTTNNETDLIAAITAGQAAVQNLSAILNTPNNASVVLATDNFQRANESPLNPAVWTADPGTALAIISDLCYGTHSGGDAEMYTGIPAALEQWVSCTIAAFAIGSEINIYLRETPTAFGALNGYQAFFFGDGTGKYGIFIYGPQGFIAQYNLAQAPQPGDRLLFSAVGNVLSVLYNGSPVILVTDTSAPNVGQAGLGIKYSSTQLDTAVSFFQTGPATQNFSVPVNFSQLADAGLALANARIIAANALNVLNAALAGVAEDS